MYLPGFLGDWTFIVNGRKRSYVLHAKLQEEAIRWANAIQEVCDCVQNKYVFELRCAVLFIGPDNKMSKTHSTLRVIRMKFLFVIPMLYKTERS